jgi:hypothetical protein
MQGEQLAGALAGIICAGIGVIVVGTLLGAVILRAACSLFNKMASRENAVPEPGFGKALGIVVVNVIASAVVGLPIGLIVGLVGQGSGLDQKVTQVIATLISLPIGFFVTGGILTFMLPTSFGRALLVTLLQYVVIFLIALVFGIVAAVVIAALGIGFGAR